MAATQVLAPGATAATSADIVVAAGGTATIGIFTNTPDGRIGTTFQVVMATPGQDNVVENLTNNRRQVQVQGPGVFRVKRGTTNAGPTFGVFKDA